MNKNSILDCIESFFRQYCPPPASLLLGLSGGPDSLSLFYGLLDYQKKNHFCLHIAHVDHGWRSESAQEAEQLRQLVLSYGLPFHLRKLQPNQLKGNLEMACREERQKFFTEICLQYNLQGVLLAHHSEDQVETILKRIFEGAHWSHLSGLKAETRIQELRILRPLLPLIKQDLLNYLQTKDALAFEDISNKNERFLRARMRQTILPALNQTFGKNISPSLEKLGKEMGELHDYFERKLTPLLQITQAGAFGHFLDLQQQLPSDPVEIKYLLRFFCARYNIPLSYHQYQLGAEALLKGAANQRFEKGEKAIYIDRKRLFFLQLPLLSNFKLVDIEQRSEGEWRWEIREGVNQADSRNSSWKEALQGYCRAWMPKGSYQLGRRDNASANTQSLDKWWTNHGVPAFMRSSFPVVYQNSTIAHEFLTGKEKWKKPLNEEGIEIIIHYQKPEI